MFFGYHGNTQLNNVIVPATKHIKYHACPVSVAGQALSGIQLSSRFPLRMKYNLFKYLLDFKSRGCVVILFFIIST